METLKDTTESSHIESSGKIGGEEREKQAFRGSEIDVGGWMFVKTNIERLKKTLQKLLKKKLEETAVSGCEGHEWIKCPWT